MDSIFIFKHILDKVYPELKNCVMISVTQEEKYISAMGFGGEMVSPFSVMSYNMRIEIPAQYEDNILQLIKFCDIRSVGRFVEYGLDNNRGKIVIELNKIFD